MIDALKLLGAPGSIPFLILSVLAGLGLVRRRGTRRAGMAWLAAVASGYLTLALPPVARAIVDALPLVAPPQSGVDVLIVIDGDNRRGRAREVQRVILERSPDVVWVLGDRWILDALKEAGVSKSLVRHDQTARTTRAQIDQVEAIAAAASGRVVIISSRLQAPRVAALVRARHLDVAVLPSPIDVEPPSAGLAKYLPAYAALRASRDALYEHAALAYYRWRGWIG